VSRLETPRGACANADTAFASIAYMGEDTTARLVKMTGMCTFALAKSS